MSRRRRHKRVSYARENQLDSIECILLVLGAVTAVGIGYIGYRFYQSEQAYAATLPPGVAVTSAGYQAWLQTPAGQATT